MKKNLIYALVIITTATAFFLKANHNTQSVISDTILDNVEALASIEIIKNEYICYGAVTAAHQASLSFTISWSLPKLMSIESVMPSSHLILCCPLLFLPPIPPSIRVFSNESTLRMRWPKYWS